MRGLSLVAASGGHSSSQCAGLSLSQPLLLRSTGSRRTGSVVVAHGPSRSAACGILPDQGSNPCPLHWQADSQPLCHQGSPLSIFLKGGCFHHFPFIKINLFDLRAYHCLKDKDKHTPAFEALQGCIYLIAFYFLPFTFYTCLAGLFDVS